MSIDEVSTEMEDAEPERECCHAIQCLIGNVSTEESINCIDLESESFGTR